MPDKVVCSYFGKQERDRLILKGNRFVLTLDQIESMTFNEAQNFLGFDNVQIERDRKLNSFEKAVASRLFELSAFPCDMCDNSFKSKGEGDTICLSCLDILRKESKPDVAKEMGINMRYAKASFDSYILAYSEQKKVAADLMSYADRIISGTSENRTLVGWTGTGKTHLACAILWEIWEKTGRKGRYMNFATLMRNIKSTYSKKQEFDFERVITTPLLVIDEIGMTKKSEHNTSLFEEIVECRWGNMLPTVLITNIGLGEDNQMDTKQFNKVMPDRVSSRLLQGASKIIPFGWEDYRGGLKEKIDDNQEEIPF
jgi:DNA replication protein DnaC